MTKQQDRRIQDAYDFIVGYKKAHDGNAPSLRQIAAGIDIPVGSDAPLRYVRILVERGYLEMDEMRKIMVVGGKWTLDVARATDGD